MKGFAGVCCVYDDDAWLPMMVEACYPTVDQLFFLVGRHPWNGQDGDNRHTIATIRSCVDPQCKIRIFEGDWPNEATQRNAGLELCARANLSYCFVVDADEIYDAVCLERMMTIATAAPDVGAWFAPFVTYWKSYRYKMVPETLHSLVFVKIGHGVFRNARAVKASVKVTFSKECGVCHHLSFARTDEQVQKKITRYSMASSVPPNWFDTVWREWDHDHNLVDLHPEWRGWCRGVVPQEPAEYPPVLRKLYDEEMSSC